MYVHAQAHRILADGLDVNARAVAQRQREKEAMEVCVVRVLVHRKARAEAPLPARVGRLDLKLVSFAIVLVRHASDRASVGWLLLALGRGLLPPASTCIAPIPCF